MRLTLNSGKIKFNILQEKSIYFDNKNNASSSINRAVDLHLPLVSVAAQTLEFKEKEISMDKSELEEKFLKNVEEFGNSKKIMNNSDQSLKFSKSHDISNIFFS